MQQKFFFKILTVLAVSVAAIAVFATIRNPPVTVAAQQSETQGALQVLDSNGKPKESLPAQADRCEGRNQWIPFASSRHAGIRESFQGKDRGGLHISAATKGCSR